MEQTELSEITKEKAYQAFIALRKSAELNGLQDMSLKEINDEINAVRNKEQNSGT